MSVWTHVAGCVRIDALPFLRAEPVEDVVRRAFGKTCAYEDDTEVWDECTVPCGSEGSVQYRVARTGTENELSWGLVYIWGDLRNYSNADEITTWLQGAINAMRADGVWVRGLSVFVEIESGKQYSLITDDEGNIKATLVD